MTTNLTYILVPSIVEAAQHSYTALAAADLVRILLRGVLPSLLQPPATL